MNPHPTEFAAPSGMVLEKDGEGVERSFQWYAAARPAADAAMAALLLILSAPVALVAMALVRLTSPGSAIYRQVRLGRGGRPFTIYKIRTMRQDCERTSGPQWSSRGDARVTPVGRALRRLHLDELPQLFNILRGEMSLIGPRPERPEFVSQLERALDRYRNRLNVRPGLTGLAQVQLPPDTDLEGVRVKLQYDLYYVDQAGPLLDLKIFLATALKLADLPFDRIRQLLALPSLAEVEHHNLLGSDQTAASSEPRSAEACGEMLPA